MISAIHTQHTAITVGKYRIAACPRALPSGRFAAQVSVASGQGSASTARIMSFVDDFATHDDATQYALAQGMDWVNGVTPTH
ncbi:MULTISPECIES: hypothetical protein [unclassified Limnohabitans]|jgi:hypothetical protein|uniref:hypothetical protein n=1 Tax=unclassified Limnohabitans TaxID=2626134 RepID=UPI001F2A109F|nr:MULTISPECIES: hypothetical protein [unclassified Limnohabitans]BDU54958.1 hypothetical protein LTEGF4_06390 [Limnohabitans sp. TEGF004]